MNVFNYSRKALLMITSLCFLSNLTYANDELKLGNVIHGGNGCPKNSAEVILDQNQENLRLRFSDYYVYADSEKRLDRKSCNLAIPIHVPSGLSVSIVQVDYDGFLSLPTNATLDFTSEYFFVGNTSEKVKKTIEGEAFGEFHLSDAVLIESEVWSNCGEDTILRVNTALTLKSNNRQDYAIAILDSANIDSGVIYRIKTRKCQK
jgi:hypothetical protein